MLMKLQNKMTLSLDQLVKKTKKEGGIPSLVEFSVQEASQLLDEMNRMNGSSEIKGRYTIKTEKEGVQNAQFIVYRHGGIRNDEREAFLRSWYEGAYSLSFDDIPLVLIIPKKQVETQPAPAPAPVRPTPPPGRVMKENGVLVLT